MSTYVHNMQDMWHLSSVDKAYKEGKGGDESLGIHKLSCFELIERQYEAFFHLHCGWCFRARCLGDSNTNLPKRNRSCQLVSYSTTSESLLKTDHH